MLSTNSDLLSVNFCLHRAFLIVSRPEKRGTEANHIAAVRDTKFIISAHAHREKGKIFILSPCGIIQSAHFIRKISQKLLVVRIGQHGHKSPDEQSFLFPQSLPCLQGLFGSVTAFRDFSADIYLYQNLGTDILFYGNTGNFLREFVAVTGMKERNFSYQILYLIRLQMPDKMPVAVFAPGLFSLNS